MNIPALIISTFCLLCSTVFAYELWFKPQKYLNRLNKNRNLFKSIFGLSFWKEKTISISFLRAVVTFVLIGSVLGIIISITGPIVYYR